MIVRMYSHLVAFLIINWGIHLTKCELNHTCTTSSNRSGRCVLVRDCQYALNILRSEHRTHEDWRYLDQNKCGESPGKIPKPLICCPLIQNVEGCGVAKIGNRIFGGSETDVGLYPWAGVIQYRNTRGRFEVQCGCTLVHHRWVLTAAHCIVGVPRKLRVYAVRFNEWNTRKKSNCTTKDDVKICRAVYEIAEEFAHPSYSIHNPIMRHDIGLLKTKVDVKFDDYVIPICLPFSETIQEMKIEGEQFVVTGWGHSDKNTPGIQRHVTLMGRNNTVCDVAFRPQRIQLAPEQMCVGGEAGQDSCRGDSGGALMYEHGIATYGIGIVSFGAYDCGTENHPGVYTKIAEYLDWIEEVMIEH